MSGTTDTGTSAAPALAPQGAQLEVPQQVAAWEIDLWGPGVSSFFLFSRVELLVVEGLVGKRTSPGF